MSVLPMPKNGRTNKQEKTNKWIKQTKKWMKKQMIEFLELRKGKIAPLSKCHTSTTIDTLPSPLHMVQVNPRTSMGLISKRVARIQRQL